MKWITNQKNTTTARNSDGKLKISAFIDDNVRIFIQEEATENLIFKAEFTCSKLV
jgi:hypothetical protein